MSSKLQKLFHIPTSALVFLVLASTGALLVDIYMLLNLDTFTSLTINGVEHLQGTEEFRTELHNMKNSFLYSALLALIVGVFSSYVIYKRKTTLRDK